MGWGMITFLQIWVKRRWKVHLIFGRDDSSTKLEEEEEEGRREKEKEE
jgi:hypothetical protein